MKFVNKQCKSTLEQLAQFNDLSAVKRSQVEMHLRRCDSCQSAWDTLEQVEQLKFDNLGFTEHRRDSIYDRLVPSIHEISREMTTGKSSFPWKPVFGGALALAAGIAVVLALFFYPRPQDHSIADFPVSAPMQEVTMPSIVTSGEDLSQGRIDKLQGIVYINGKPYVGMDGKFETVDGTKVAVADDSKLNFRIGRFVKVALVNETSWSIDEINSELISLHLERGKLAVEYDGSLGRKMEVHTPTTVVHVKGTVFTVEVFGDGATQVSVTRGHVEVASNIAGQPSIGVEAGNLVQLPGHGRTVALGDHQRILAAEVEALSDNFGTNSGRLVRFDGGQEHVQVEIDDRVVGFTPLTILLPPGPVSYRLSKPGMKTVEAQLAKEQVSEHVKFSLSPSEDYVPRVANLGSKKRGRKATSALKPDKVKDEESKNFVVRAKAAMSSGDLPYAAQLLEETARRVDGEQLISALSLLAECYAAMGNYLQAADIFDRVASLVPGTAIAQNSKYEVGRLSMDYIGDYDRARAAFTAYVAAPAAGQLQEDAYFSLCELYGREGIRKNALRCFSDFLRMFPSGHRNAYAHLWRGVLHQEVDQQWRFAERDLITFIHTKPRHPRCEEARYRIALGRYNVRDYKGAMQMFQEYLDEHPGGQYAIRVERLKQTLWEKMNKRQTK